MRANAKSAEQTSRRYQTHRTYRLRDTAHPCHDPGMAHARELTGSRRDLAFVLSDGWRTANEAAKELGRPTGSIFGVLRRMHAEGLLEADTDPEEPTRGTQYRLRPSHHDVLRESLDERAELGRVAEGQRLLFVERRKGRARASAVLSSSVAAGVIAWGAEMPTGWLLALVPDASSFRVSQLVVAFEGAGCRCHEAPVDALASGQLLRERAAASAGRGLPT